MRKILCTTSSFGNTSPKIISIIKDQGFELILNPHGRKLEATELQKLLVEFKPIGLLAGTESIARETLELSKGFLKVISRVGVGWDAVDHDAAKDLGITVFRTTGVLNQAVAELTMGMMLCALRNIALHDRKIRSGIWEKQIGAQLKDKTVGVIGFGAIGQRVGELVRAFGAKIIYFDPYPKAVKDTESVTLDELLARADIITLHADGTKTIIGAQEFGNLRKGVILINTARGGLIEEKALYSALQSGQVSYACLDVFEKEPYTGELSELENVVLTSHIGSYAKEARKEMEEMAVDNLLKELA